MKTIKVFANTLNLGKQQYDAKLTNVEKIHEGAIGWVIALNCGTYVTLPSTTIFTVEGSMDKQDT